MADALDLLLSSIKHARRRADAQALLPFFQDVTGYDPVIWSGSIIGFGRYHYTYDSGREGDFLATGFAPRKASMSIYILPGYQDYSEILSRLGPHKTGKACLYITRLDHIDMTVLRELIQTGLRDLSLMYPVYPI
ncbi:MAG: DUF1801 domain-containing protein [Pseudomonadota bacterium]